MSAGQRGLLTAGAVLLHGLLAIVVWHSSTIPDIPPEPAPLMVSLISNEVVQVAPPTPPVAEPPKPVPPKPVATPPKVQPTVVASNRAPAPQDMVVPAAPEPPAPTPPPVQAAQPTAPVATAPEPVTPQAPKVLPSSGVKPLVPAKPIYPPASLELGESGTVTMMLLLDEQGRLKDIQVTKSSGYPRLDRAAIAAERLARYAPYIEAGVPRSVYVPHSITFNLDER
ncbi:energy transducer TonB [Aquabacterium sp.]|uniref:energy transducer TonB n=1 Tax=Aquabacterium sp. TaxID=1872578 RepID=UPI003D6D4049